ncbi:hypothetical protein GALMADRAFT_156621 [Galerina marginata CBS 339.88]|uniref:F-box domain-containing protein n=1 Tax=Galerina marginata (strain CBS 339.88) TaxID=685588 RepID=A0A067SXL9_GALM3|nr:hypothetical protein GALMADRAFT_156621 [Galerina marginata CBS 339.88]
MATAPAKLSHLPVDILLYLLLFCELADNVSFSMVCPIFYKLSQQRGYWINALQEARIVRPIACPLQEDLTKHDHQSLKRIALHTLRLDYNWSLPQPKIKGPIKAVILGVPPLDVVFQVPGTELYVLHSRSSGNISAWDIGLGKQVSPDIYISRRLMDVSPGQDEPGKFSIGILAILAPSVHELWVICLEYGSGGVNLQVTLQYTLEPDMLHWAVFMTTEFIGVLQYNPNEWDDTRCPVDIIALNVSSGTKTTITTDIPRNMVAEHGYESGAFVLAEESPGVRFIRTEGTLTTGDFYGVPAVSLRLASLSFLDIPEELEVDPVGPGRFQIQAIFWTRPEQDDNNNPLVPYHNINIPGSLQDSPDSSWLLMALPHSGRKVLIVIQFGSEIRLQLVHFHPHKGDISVQQIELPPFIDIEQVHGLSLDDHRGVITLLDTRGVLYALPYA